MAVTNNSSLFSFYGSIATSLEGKQTTESDGTVNTVINGTQVLGKDSKGLVIKPGKDSDWLGYLKSLTEVNKDLSKNVKAGNTDNIPIIVSTLSQIFEQVQLTNTYLDAISTPSGTSKSIKAIFSLDADNTESIQKLLEFAISAMDGSTLIKPAQAKLFSWSISTIGIGVQKYLNSIASVNVDLNKQEKLMSSIEQFGSMMTNMSKFINPINALSLAVGFKLISKTISNGLQTIFVPLSKIRIKPLSIATQFIESSLLGLIDKFKQYKIKDAINISSMTFGLGKVFNALQLISNSLFDTKFPSKNTVDAFAYLSSVGITNILKISKLRLNPINAILISRNLGKIVDAIISVGDKLSSVKFPSKEKVDDLKYFVYEGLASVLTINLPLIGFGKNWKNKMHNILDTILNWTDELNLIRIDSKKYEELGKSLSTLLHSIDESMSSKILVKTKMLQLTFNTLIAVSKASDKININVSFVKPLNQLVETFASKNFSLGIKNIKSFTVGIATLGVALAAFAAITPLVFVASLGIKTLGWAVRSLTFGKGKSNPLVSIALFTASLATLGVAIWAFGEIVSGTAMLKTVGGLATLYLASQIFSGQGLKIGKWNIKAGKPAWKTMIGTATAIAAVGLAIHYGFKDLQGMDLVKFAIGLAAFGVAMKVWSKAKIKLTDGASMISSAAGIGALGIGMTAWRLVTPAAVLVATGGLLGIGVGMKIWSSLSISPFTGLSIAAVGAGIGALGLGIATWRLVTPAAALTAALTTLSIAGILHIIPPTALFGAGALAAAGGALFVMGLGIKMFPNDPKHLLSVAGFVGAIGLAISGLGAIAPIAIMGAGVLSISGLAMLAFGHSLSEMSKAGVTIDTVNVAKSTILGIAETFGNNKMLMAKASIGATAFIPAGIALRQILPNLILISEIKTDKKQLDTNLDFVKSFILKTSEIFGSVGKETSLVNLWKGVKSVSDIGSTIKTLAEGIVAIAELKFYEYNVVNGKLQIKSVRAFTKQDFDTVGTGLQLLINAVTKPLADIGKTKPRWFGRTDVQKGINSVKELGSLVKNLADGVVNSIEATKIDGLYEKVGKGLSDIINSVQGALISIGKDGKTKRSVKKGIKALSDISSVIEPLSNLMNAMNNNNGIDFKKEVDNIVLGMNSLLSFVNKNKVKIDDISWFKTFSESLEQIHSTEIVAVNDAFDSMLTKMADDRKWKKTFTNLDKLASKLKTITTSFNSTDTAKLMLVDSISKEINKANDNSKLSALIEVMLKMVDRMSVPTQVSSSSTTNNTTTNNTSTNIDSRQVPADVKSEQTIEKAVQQASTTELENLIQDLIDIVESFKRTTFKVQSV